jgi:acetaldehyde dehydrogenase (acetylating)
MQNEIKDNDLISMQQARDLSLKARQAYEIFSTFPQEKVDKIVGAMAKAGQEASEYLARFAVEETRYGKIEDKIIKNLFASTNVYDSIKNLKTVGIIKEDKENRITHIAHPMGVVCAITPTTNPTSTIIFKALIAIKSRNAIVFAPHPYASRCSKETADILSRAAEDAGAPKNLISCMSIVTLEGSSELMRNKNIAIILATGGIAMVKAAHSSGKPAIGVGPGNTPAYVDKSADLTKAASDLISSKSFDYGVICASEQAIIVHRDIDDEFKNIISSMGGFFLDQEQVEKVSQNNDHQ